jgi:O-methyltransferase involved in polyketide biosynthesis
MVIVAADQYAPSPLVHDPWASRMMPAFGRFAAGLARWSAGRRAFIAVSERRIPGGWASFLCRKHYGDNQLVNAVVKGIDAVVILGVARYLKPAGRDEPVSELERAVYAER